MKVLHVLSTAPWRASYGDKQPFERDAIETDVMALAAYEWSRHNELHLYTDEAGEAWLDKQHFKHVYTKVVRLPELPAINHRIFWDIYKPFALQIAGHVNTLLADNDLVIWNTNSIPLGYAWIGHFEPKDWECYRSNRDRFERYGFTHGGWNWTAPPVNTCLLSAIGAEEWFAWTMAFAENYSRHPLKPEECPNWWYEPALFGGQHLLGMLFDRFGIEPNEMFKVRHSHHEPSDAGFHLWGRKEVYRTCVEPRLHMRKWLNALLESRDLKIRINPTVETIAQEIRLSGRVPVFADREDNQWSRTVTTEKGMARAQDPCTGLWRYLTTRDKIYRGDVLKVEAGSYVVVSFNGKLLYGDASEVEHEIEGEQEAAIWRTDLT